MGDVPGPSCDCALPIEAAALLATAAVLLVSVALTGRRLGLSRHELALEKRLAEAKRRQVPVEISGEEDGDVSAPWEIEYKELRFERCIAKGGQGDVWLGNWLDTVVAIKTPLKGQTEMHKEKFREEARLMSTMHHPNVVMFLGACLDPENLALVLEYVPNGSLHDLFSDKEKYRRFSGFAHRFAVDIARGVKYLHTRCAIIQRDLKPRNLLIDAANNVKLCDFGLSRSLVKDETMTACGTPFWTAPEIIRNEPYDEKADVYSYAIILLQLVTGQAPYSGLEGLEVALRVAHHDLRPTIPPDCPEAYSNLIVACWAQKPADRPSFAQVLDQLNVIKKSSSTRATGVELPELISPEQGSPDRDLVRKAEPVT